jgi:hypothetical protein
MGSLDRSTNRLLGSSFWPEHQVIRRLLFTGVDHGFLSTFFVVMVEGNPKTETFQTDPSVSYSGCQKYIP